VFTHEKNFGIQMFFAIITVALGLFFGLAVHEWVIIILTIGIVLVLELVNSALELLIDVVVPRLQEKAGAVKDIMAGAVLCAAIMASVVGICIFFPYIVELFV
jgi:diacylglycerol kinase